MAGFYSQLASRVIHTGSVRSGCLPRSPRGVILNTSCHRISYAYVITKLHLTIIRIRQSYFNSSMLTTDHIKLSDTNMQGAKSTVNIAKIISKDKEKKIGSVCPGVDRRRLV